MITAIVALLGGWRATAFAAVALLAFGAVGAQTWRLHSAQNALAQLRASVAEADAKAQAVARAESERRDAASSGATQSMLDYLGHSLPTIESTSHATIERIRTVYRDRPVAAVCARPDGVRAELDQARARANGTAASGLPAHAAVSGAADSSAVSHGRVGNRGDGDHRIRAGEVDRREGLHGQAPGGSSDPLSLPIDIGAYNLPAAAGAYNEVVMKRNALTTAVIAGIAGVASFAGMANAVDLNPDGLGQVLVYPYYAVNLRQDTTLQVVDTSDVGNPVKVRFLKGNSRDEVVDFNLYLTPMDVWTSEPQVAALAHLDFHAYVPPDDPGYVAVPIDASPPAHMRI